MPVASQWSIIAFTSCAVWRSSHSAPRPISLTDNPVFPSILYFIQGLLLYVWATRCHLMQVCIVSSVTPICASSVFVSVVLPAECCYALIIANDTLPSKWAVKKLHAGKRAFCRAGTSLFHCSFGEMQIKSMRSDNPVFEQRFIKSSPIQFRRHRSFRFQ